MAMLATAPLAAEIDRGELVALPIDEPVSRSIALCASKNIPLTNAAAAVERLVLEVAHSLCESGQWQATSSR